MPTCNYCKSEKSSIIAEYTRFEKNNVRQCSNCGLVYLEQDKRKEDVVGFYSYEYRNLPTHCNLPPKAMYNKKIVQNDADNRFEFVRRHIDLRGKKVLEIGSSAGNFMAKLVESGCGEVVGQSPLLA